MKTLGLMFLAWGTATFTSVLVTPGEQYGAAIVSGALISGGALLAGKEDR